MTIVCLPIDASGGTPAYTAQATRNAFSALLYNGTARSLGAQSGAVPGHLPAIFATTTVWAVGAGAFVVDPAFTTTQSPYLVSIDATVQNNMTAANASLSRIDALDLQISDTAIDSSGARAATVVYTAGTAGSGSAPAGVARSVRLATINVPASGGGSPTVSLWQQYAVAAGGILPVASNGFRDALITAPVPGMANYRLDNRVGEIYDATLGWATIFDPGLFTVETAYTVAWGTTTGGTCTVGTGGSINGWYKKVGFMVDWQVTLITGSDAVTPSGTMHWSLPTIPNCRGGALKTQVGSANFLGGANVNGVCYGESSSAAFFQVAFNGSAGFAGSTVPATWQSRSVTFAGRYESLT